MAAKPPSFPFYGQDFQTGTMAMTPAERGVYVDCLWYQWASGGVPADDIKRLAQVMRCTPADAKKYWTALASKFTRGDDGLYRNARLEVVRADKQKWHDSRKNNGGKGGRPPSKQETTSEPSGSQDANLVVPFSLSLSSVPTEQRDAPALDATTKPRPYRHALIPRRDLGAFWEGPIFNIPDGWATRAIKASNGKAFSSDVVRFAQALTARLERDGGEAPAQGFLAWLDAEWAAYRQPAVSDGYRPASEWIEQNRKASEGSCSPEEAKAILAASWGKRPGAARG